MGLFIRLILKQLAAEIVNKAIRDEGTSQADQGRGPATKLGRVLINRDCSATGCRKRRARSGDLLPPPPPGEKATARQDQAGKASTGDGRGDGGGGVEADEGFGAAG